MLSLLDSARAGLLYNVKTRLFRNLGSREISKNDVHTFFLKHPVSIRTSALTQSTLANTQSASGNTQRAPAYIQCASSND